jgi:hypothetical protein
VAEDARAVLHAATLRIGRPPIEPLNASERDGSRAHGTWFERHVEARANETLLTGSAAGSAQHQHFRVGGRIRELAGPVAVRREKSAARRNERRADRYLATRGGRSRLRQRPLHGRFAGRKGGQLYYLDLAHGAFLLVVGRI